MALNSARSDARRKAGKAPVDLSLRRCLQAWWSTAHRGRADPYPFVPRLLHTAFRSSQPHLPLPLHMEAPRIVQPDLRPGGSATRRRRFLGALHRNRRDQACRAPSAEASAADPSASIGAPLWGAEAASNLSRHRGAPTRTDRSPGATDRRREPAATRADARRPPRRARA
jgi:hypothetical protein